jgi:hypothetical protein
MHQVRRASLVTQDKQRLFRDDDRVAVVSCVRCIRLINVVTRVINRCLILEGCFGRQRLQNLIALGENCLHLPDIYPTSYPLNSRLGYVVGALNPKSPSRGEQSPHSAHTMPTQAGPEV